MDLHDDGAPPAPAPPPAEEGAPTWMVTFGDMMSLLLTFFILLFSMSELEMERFLLASQSLSQAMGGTAVREVPDPAGLVPDPANPALKMQSAGRAPTVPLPQPGAPSPATQALANPAPVPPAGTAGESAPGGTADDPVDRFVDDYLERLALRLEAFVADHELDPEVRVERRAEGVYLRMESAALFRSGDATVLPPARAVLTELAALTRELEVGVAVSGHADNRPIDGRFASNWELSAARAAGVARLLVRHGQDPARLRVESFGEHRPIASNATAAGRARNRRVDLFFDRADVEAEAERLMVAAAGAARPVEAAAPADSAAGR